MVCIKGSLTFTGVGAFKQRKDYNVQGLQNCKRGGGGGGYCTDESDYYLFTKV